MYIILNAGLSFFGDIINYGMYISLKILKLKIGLLENVR